MNMPAQASIKLKNKTPLLKFLQSLKSNKFLYLIMLAAILYFIVFRIKPIFNMIYYSLFEYDIGGNHKFIKFLNFENVFRMKDFWRAFRNTVYISFGFIIFAQPFPIIVSLLLTELLGKKFKKVVQTVIVIPYFLSWVVISGLFVLILSPTTGPVNELIKALGFNPIYFFAEPKYFRALLVISFIWKQCGYSTIIYMAAISSIPTELYESAVLDGASRFRQAWHITLPFLKETIFTVYTLGLAAGMMINEQVLVMYNSLVYETGDVLATLSFRLGLQGMDKGNSTVISMFGSTISLLLFCFSNYLSKKLMGRKLL